MRGLIQAHLYGAFVYLKVIFLGPFKNKEKGLQWFLSAYQFPSLEIIFFVKKYLSDKSI